MRPHNQTDGQKSVTEPLLSNLHFNYVCICNCVCVCDLDVSVCSQFMVPQDDLSVFSSSRQQSAAPHLTHTENTSLVTFDLPTNLKCYTHTHTISHLSSTEVKYLLK